MINVVFMNMSTKIHEAVTPNEDGSFTVFINARLSADAQRKAYLHALTHIRNDDFRECDVNMAEYEAHKTGLKDVDPEDQSG